MEHLFLLWSLIYTYVQFRIKHAGLLQKKIISILWNVLA